MRVFAILSHAGVCVTAPDDGAGTTTSALQHREHEHPRSGAGHGAGPGSRRDSTSPAAISAARLRASITAMSVSHGPSRCAHRVGPRGGARDRVDDPVRLVEVDLAQRAHAVVERLDLVEVDGGGGGGEAPLRAHHFARLPEPDALGGVGKHRPGREHHLRDEHDGQHRHGLLARPGRGRDQETEAHPRERGDRDVDRELEPAGPERDRVVGPVLGGGGDEHVDDDLQRS